MAYELTKNLLGSLIKQQRDAEMMQQTPEFQSQVDKMFANRIKFARNQLVYEKIANAKDSNELLEAIKTVSPELYMKKKKETFVSDQIMKELTTKSEQQRDYGLINYLASSIGYGDVGPIDQRPVPKERFDQEIRLRESSQGDRMYGGRPDLSLRRQREAIFMDYLDRGILYNGQPATGEQKESLQKSYLETGTIPKEYDIEAKPLKPQTVQRPTKDIMKSSEELAFKLIEKEWDKLKSVRVGDAWLGLQGNSPEETFNNLKALTDEELDKLFKKNGKFVISEELYDKVRLGKKYGSAKDYIEVPGNTDVSQYLNQPTQYDPKNPEKLEFD